MAIGFHRSWKNVFMTIERLWTLWLYTIGDNSMSKYWTQPEYFANKDSICDGSCAGWTASHLTGSIQNSSKWKAPYSTTLEKLYQQLDTAIFNQVSKYTTHLCRNILNFLSRFALFKFQSLKNVSILIFIFFLFRFQKMQNF